MHIKPISQAEALDAIASSGLGPNMANFLRLLVVQFFREDETEACIADNILADVAAIDAEIVDDDGGPMEDLSPADFSVTCEASHDTIRQPIALRCGKD